MARFRTLQFLPSELCLVGGIQGFFGRRPKCSEEHPLVV